MIDADAPIGGCAQGHTLRQHGAVVRWLHARCLRCGAWPASGYSPHLRSCAWCATRGWRSAGLRGRVRRIVCPECLAESALMRLRAWAGRWPALEEAS